MSERNGNVLASHLNYAMAKDVEIDVYGRDSENVIASGLVTHKIVDAVQGLVYTVGGVAVGIESVGKIRRAGS